MSGSMEKLTAAIEANTAAIHKMIEMSGGKPATKASQKAEPKSEAKAESKPASKAKKITMDDVAEAFGAYLRVKDKDEREARKANVKAIIDYFGVPKATEIDPDNYEEALGYLQQYIDGETPEFDGGGDNGGDEALV